MWPIEKGAYTIFSIKDYQIWDGFFALAKLNGGRTNLGQPPVADALSEVRSGETSNVRCADLRRLSLRASTAALTGTAPNEVRLRAGNPWIAARNPRASAYAGRGGVRSNARAEKAPKDDKISD